MKKRAVLLFSILLVSGLRAEARLCSELFTSGELQTKREGRWFRTSDPKDSRFYIESHLSQNGILTFTVVAKSPMGEVGSLSGKSFFITMMEYYHSRGYEVHGIKARWTEHRLSDNYHKYLQGIEIDGLAPKAAAFATWTGQQAWAHGFRKIEYMTQKEEGGRKKPSEPNEIIVLFVREGSS